jgi:hypothetical protein
MKSGRYIFTIDRKSKSAENHSWNIQYIDIIQQSHRFNIYKKTQTRPHKWSDSMYFDPDVGQMTKLPDVVYDIDFLSLRDSYGADDTVTGMIYKCHDEGKEELMQEYCKKQFGAFIEKKVKIIYELNNDNKGYFIIFNNNSATLIIHGNGIKYVNIFKGFVKKAKR